MTAPDPQAVAIVAKAISAEPKRYQATNYDDFPPDSFALARVAIRAHLDFIHRMSASG